MDLLKRHTLSCLLAIAATLSACDTGINLTEDEEELTENDTVFHGPSNGAHWELRLNDTDDNFTLRKYNAATSNASQYRVSGDYNELSSGFIQLQINSGSTDDIDNNTLTGIRLEEDSIVFFPFADNEEDLLALIPENEDCPSSSRGNSFFLERSPASSANGFFIAEHRYSFSNNEVQLTDAVQLPDLATFSEQTRTSVACENGFADHSEGTNYLNTNSAVLEYSNVGSDNAYERMLTIRRNSVSTLNELDSPDYVGFLRNYEPSDRQFASAECDDGVCQIFSESDPDAVSKDTAVYQLTFEEENLSTNGLTGVATASISAEGSSDSFNAVCVVNDDLVSGSSSTTKVIACHAVDPADGSSVMSVLLASKS